MEQENNPLGAYGENRSAYTENRNALTRAFRRVSWLRLLAIVAVLMLGYSGIRTGQSLMWWLSAAAFAGFLLLMRWHAQLAKRVKLAKTLLDLNDAEAAYVESGKLPFPDGSRYQQTQHPYSYDLDLFGPQSLYQHLNRAHTVTGTAQLAETLQMRAPDAVIESRQKAVQELSPLLNWRQDYMAKAQLAHDSEKITDALRSWTNEQETLPRALLIISYLLPATGFALSALGLVLHYDMLLLNLAVTVFILNLIVFGSQLKKMNREIAHADKTNETLLRYSELLQAIERREWNSELLSAIRNDLLNTGNPASGRIYELSRIFAALESLQNGFGAILFNGTVLYHLHTYRRLLRWKRGNARRLDSWLRHIGELEVLISFANLQFNNPDFCYPELNTRYELRFTDLGHPLIPAGRRVSNSVDFTEKPFIILTGSNMSGKSTFLRTLGINLVLANAGAPICAAKASVHPVDILVSMRLSDSLADSESYFFAEVKRLKEIMDGLDARRCFILLDEILRGTNSDDKRTGTIEVIRKVIEKRAIGAIATHDLEVCNTTDEFPDRLVNKCFEVEIINNDLHFDYRLRDGICKNKSATFLMEKMGVI